MRYLYSLLFYLCLPFIFLRLLYRSRKFADNRKRWSERLGFMPVSLKECIWIHTVSVGETLAAMPLIKKIQKEYPNTQILVTNMTATGAARVKASLGDTVIQAYIPYDVPDAVARFLDRSNPRIAIIMETELWPNLFAACKKRNIPIIVTNARLSEKSAKNYQRIHFLTRPMLDIVHTVAAQNAIDGNRFLELGLSPSKLVITGNIKFDMELPNNLLEKQIELRAMLGNDRLIWIAASTHAGEEEIVLNAHKKLCEKYPGCLLILVPRHPNRFEDVFTLTKNRNFKVKRRTENVTRSEDFADTKVYLADTMGELFLMYAVCDIAFVAGSFVPIGGHNVLECALLGKPIITGPQLFNFAEITRLLLAEKGMIKVENENELTENLIRLLADPKERQQLGTNAKNYVDKNRGSLQKQFDLIKTILNG